MSTTRRGFLGVLAAVLPVSLLGFRAAKAPRPVLSVDSLPEPLHLTVPVAVAGSAWATGSTFLRKGDVFTLSGHYQDNRLIQYVCASDGLAR